MKFDIKKITEIASIGKKVLDLTEKQASVPQKKDAPEPNKPQVISEQMTSEEEDALIESTKNKLKGRSLSTPQEITSTLKAFTEAANDAVKFCEVQETKREEIRANRDFRIAQLKAQRDVIIDYLQRSFDERRYLFEQQFKVVDHALTTGNTDELALSLQSINDLAKSSPFKALADIGNVQRALTQDGSTFDI